MGKHDDPGRQEPDSGSGRGDDGGKDTSRHSVEDDKQTSTVPDPDDYK
jgi:hypothetical protein